MSGATALTRSTPRARPDDTRYTLAGAALPKPAAYSIPSGFWFYPQSQQGSTTSTTLGLATLRLIPWTAPVALTIAAIQMQMVGAGDAGQKFRPAIYADTGNYYPGALLLDPGQLAADVANSAPTVTSLALAINRGDQLWIGGVQQAYSSTASAIVCVTPQTLYSPLPIPQPTTPTVQSAATGYSTSGITGALPATFPAGAASSGQAPRLALKAA